MQNGLRQGRCWPPREGASALTDAEQVAGTWPGEGRWHTGGPGREALPQGAGALGFAPTMKTDTATLLSLQSRFRGRGGGVLSDA